MRSLAFYYFIECQKSCIIRIFSSCFEICIFTSFNCKKVKLAQESDDEKRRSELANLLDKELAAAADEYSGDGNDASTEEIPKFAQLFQLSLDNVGALVQEAARVKALERQQNANDGADLGDSSDRDANQREEVDLTPPPKTSEELQLWACIDMMIQSKTRVKLYMGTLGSKGTFR